MECAIISIERSNDLIANAIRDYANAIRPIARGTRQNPPASGQKVRGTERESYAIRS